MEIFKLTKSYKGTDFVHIITEDDKREIEQLMAKHDLTEQRAIRQFAKTCEWEEVE